MSLRFLDITKNLGIRLIAEHGLGGEVTHVDLGVEQGGGCPTCYYTEYPVTVHYTNVHGKETTYTKTFQNMSEIIKIMEDIADDVWDL